MHLRREDLASRELRAYLKNELRGDESLMYTQPRQTPRRLWQRLRRWMNGSAEGAAAAPSEPTSIRSPDLDQIPEFEDDPLVLSSAAALPGSGPARDIEVVCPHPVQEDLGAGSGVSYALCLSCGAILVLTMGGGWVIPAVDPRDCREEAAAMVPPFSKYP